MGVLYIEQWFSNCCVCTPIHKHKNVTRTHFCCSGWISAPVPINCWLLLAIWDQNHFRSQWMDLSRYVYIHHHTISVSLSLFHCQLLIACSMDSWRWIYYARLPISHPPAWMHLHVSHMQVALLPSPASASAPSFAYVRSPAAPSQCRGLSSSHLRLC